VVNKPAGILVVRARGVVGKTLLDLAEDRWGRGVRPVHRLDKPTTGCCVVARTEHGQRALSDAFRKRIVDKRYVALLEGVPEWKKLAIDARLKRVDDPAAKKGPVAWQEIADDGQRALTRVRVLGTGETRALVEARLETGRMHQIRAHLAHVGFPVVGDEIYGTGRKRARLFLHAWLLSFPAPTGGRRFVRAPLPNDFKSALGAAGIEVAERLAEEEQKFLAQKPKPKPKPKPKQTQKQTPKPKQKQKRKQKPTRKRG
jgi:RluA family pseudouridine synthase